MGGGGGGGVPVRRTNSEVKTESERDGLSSVLLYVQSTETILKTVGDGKPRTGTSTFTQLPSSERDGTVLLFIYFTPRKKVCAGVEISVSLHPSVPVRVSGRCWEDCTDQLFVTKLGHVYWCRIVSPSVMRGGWGWRGGGGGVGWCVCVWGGGGGIIITTGRDRFSFVNLRNLVSGGLEANTACAIASIPCVKHLHQPKAKEIEFYSYHPLLVCYQSVCCLCCL